MVTTGQFFNISYKNQQVKVEVYRIDRSEVLKVLLPGIPLYIIKSKDGDSNDFWISLPQGRQQQAEEIGEIIDKTIYSKKAPPSTQATLF